MMMCTSQLGMAILTLPSLSLMVAMRVGVMVRQHLSPKMFMMTRPLSFPYFFFFPPPITVAFEEKKINEWAAAMKVELRNLW